MQDTMYYSVFFEPNEPNTITSETFFFRLKCVQFETFPHEPMNENPLQINRKPS